jgi:hypothetical protein
MKSKSIYWYILPALLVLLVILLILLWGGTGSDSFGKDHPIPDGLEYSLPLAEDSQPAVDSLDSSTWLSVWNDVQGGIYKYDFCYGALPAGEIFLRCYEVTGNIPLSTDRIEERSKVPTDSTSAFSRLVNHQQFTIYEGDWDDYYAARIEVWFRDAATKQERKLMEKVYRVEGWMR